MVKTRERVSDAAGNVRPYVERAMKDEDVRENVRNAFEAAREVYEELVGGRGVASAATRVATDKDMQENLKKAIDELRSAANRVQGKDRHKGRNTTLLLGAIALGILFNPMTGPDTRRWLRQKITGESEDFTYQSGDSS